MVDKYDVIHVGLLVTVVEKDNPLPVLSNLLRMLSMPLRALAPWHGMFGLILAIEPGGYLQWDEADLGGLHRETTGPAVASTNCDELYGRLDNIFRRNGETYS